MKNEPLPTSPFAKGRSLKLPPFLKREGWGGLRKTIAGLIVIKF